MKQRLGEEKTGVVVDKLSDHERFFRWFTKNEVQSLLEQAGFVIEDIQDEYADGADRGNVKVVVALARKK